MNLNMEWERLKDSEIEEILFQDIPDIDASSESESDDESANNTTNNFDRVFEKILQENILIDNEDVDVSHSFIEDPQPSTSSKAASTTNRKRKCKSIHSRANKPKNNPETTATVSNPRREEAVLDRKWRKRDEATNIPDYSADEGVFPGVFESCSTAFDVWRLFIDPLLDNIVYQTNLYAVQVDKKLWTPLTKEEFLAFLGINFFMGYHVLPSINSYWELARDMDVPFVRECMTRSRFCAILSVLHVNDNHNIPDDCKDKLYKLRPLIDGLNQQFSKLYLGTRALSVDESIIKFKGRSSLKQYNPMKPIKRGYKLWCICDQRGYTLSFRVYQGKNEELEKEFENFGLGERVVLELTKPFWGTNRQVFCDNYFTSVSLLEKLKANNILACGTIRGNRKGLPQNLLEDKKLERGESDCRFSSLDIGFWKWRDNKVVLLASNYHGNEIGTVKRTNKDGSRTNIPCPTVVVDYNRFMGGVDHADRLRALYCVDRKSRKWWHRLFFGLMDMIFVNAYVVYNTIDVEGTGKPVSVLDFRRSLAMGLMSQVNLKKRKMPQPDVVRKRGISVPDDIRRANLGIHWVKFTNERKRCELCSALYGIQSRPSTKCSHCNVHLCVNEKKNCFAEYHEVNI